MFRSTKEHPPGSTPAIPMAASPKRWRTPAVRLVAEAGSPHRHAWRRDVGRPDDLRGLPASDESRASTIATKRSRAVLHHPSFSACLLRMSNESGRSCQALGRSAGPAWSPNPGKKRAPRPQRCRNFIANGVLNVARQLGMLPQQPLPPGPDTSCSMTISSWSRRPPALYIRMCAAEKRWPKGSGWRRSLTSSSTAGRSSRPSPKGWVMWITTHTLRRRASGSVHWATSGRRPGRNPADKAYRLDANRLPAADISQT